MGRVVQKKWAFVTSYFSTKGMAPYCVPDGHHKCHLSSHFSMVYHFATLAVWVMPPELMLKKKKQIHKIILLSPKWRLLLTSALLAPEFIAIRGTVFLLVAECHLKCVCNFGSSIDGPG